MAAPAGPRELFASVATYATVEYDTAAALLQEAAAALLLPHASAPDLEHTVRYAKRGSGRVQVAPLQGLDWGKAGKAGPLAWLAVSAFRAANLETTQSPSVATAALRFTEDPRRASVLELSISQALFSGPVPRAAQERLVAWTQGAFARLGGAVGYLTLDYVSANVFGSMSPFEATVGLSYPWASMAFRDKVRGYYWGNLLGAAHVERAGAALAAVPAARREALPGGGLYLQLSDDINDIPREGLARLKEALLPLLPEGYAQSPDYHAALPPFTL